MLLSYHLKYRRLNTHCSKEFLEEVYVPFSKSCDNRQNERSNLNLTPQEKIKTRGTPQPNSLEQPGPLAGVQPAPYPQFRVSARALKVFRVLFFNPLAEGANPPGEIPWKEFLVAMVEIGFAPDKHFGSVWQFHPTANGCATANITRGINFDEPHPRPKLSYQYARINGRRLNRAFGWEGGMFVEK
jgi:hypothetical protein